MLFKLTCVNYLFKLHESQHNCTRGKNKSITFIKLKLHSICFTDIKTLFQNTQTNSRQHSNFKIDYVLRVIQNDPN